MTNLTKLGLISCFCVAACGLSFAQEKCLAEFSKAQSGVQVTSDGNYFVGKFRVQLNNKSDKAITAVKAKYSISGPSKNLETRTEESAISVVVQPSKRRTVEWTTNERFPTVPSHVRVQIVHFTVTFSDGSSGEGCVARK